MRLLICLNCVTVEELPDFKGDNPEEDVLLEELAGRHAGPKPIDGSKVTKRLDFGPDERHFGNMLHIEDEVWGNPKYRDEILAQIKSGTTGFESDFYATKNTFVEDAGKCYNAHQRPKDFCIDWHNKTKRLGNPLKGSKAKVFLCDFCVVASRVNTAKAESGIWTP